MAGGTVFGGRFGVRVFARSARRRGLALVGLLLLVLVVAGCNVAPISPGELMLTVGKQPVAVAIGDVDGDGRNDVATANAGDDTVTVLHQDDWGGFDSGRLTLKLPAAGTPTAIALGKFSSKQRADVVVASKGTDTLEVFSNPANGAKPTTSISLAAGSAPSALAVADLNGDGYDDLVVATHAAAGIGCVVRGCVLVFDGSATGLHAQLVTIGLGSDPNASYDPVALALGHYYGGNRTDLAIADLANNRVLFVPGTAAGGFTVDPSQFASVSYAHPTELANDAPAGKLEIGGGADCALASPAGIASVQSGFSLCAPATVTPLIHVPASGGEPATDLPPSTVVGAWNPSDGGATFRSQLVLLRPYANGGGGVLAGATAAASGQLVSEWGPDDIAFVFPAQNKVLLALAEATWASDTTSVSFSKVAPGATVTKTFTGQLADHAFPLEGLTVSVSGANANQFKASFAGSTGSCGANDAYPASSLGNPCSISISVTFAPTSAGTKHATLSLDDPANNNWGVPLARVSIPLTGTAKKGKATKTGSGGAGTGTGTGSTSSSSASSGKPAPARTGPLVSGVADDYGKFASDSGASFFSTVRSLGMGENRMTVLWQAGQTGVSATDASFLDRSIAEAQRQGVGVVLSVYPATASQHDPAQFCAFARAVAQRYPYVKKIIVGNEPNKADFWSPVDPAAYTNLLAQCYDQLHPLGVTVVGGALSARQVGSGRSPVEFLAGMGAAYRALGRKTPLMDELSFHPYPNPGRIAQGAAAGYEWPNAGPPDLDRVKQAVEDAFAGTGQPTFMTGLQLMIDEIGWQAAIPSQYASLYTGTENAVTVSEAQQAQFYAAEVAQAACDQQVAELLLFHLVDETALNAGTTSGGWQSGLLRADLSQRPSFASVRSAIAAGCTGAAHTWTPAGSVVGGSLALSAVQQQVKFKGTKQPGVKFTIGASAAEGVAWKVTIKNAAGTVVVAKQGTRSAPFDAKAFIAPILLGSGSYTATVTLTATENSGRWLSATKSAASS